MGEESEAIVSYRNAFITDARKYAEQAAFVQDAKSNMETRLKGLLEPHVKGVVIQYRESIELSSL
jgi:hypothetical protein